MPKISLLSPASQSPPPSAGCRWSAENWSCAYDSVFMTLFYVYCAVDTAQKEGWGVMSYPLGRLAEAYDTLLQGDINLFNRALFDKHWDKLRDWLNSVDPRAYP